MNAALTVIKYLYKLSIIIVQRIAASTVYRLADYR